VSAPSAPKTSPGNFFEDFRLGQQIRHATPRTVSVGDVALYQGLFGGRFAVQSSDIFAQNIGFPKAPIDDLLVFHIVFGKTVPDISLNAVANLGYADCRFLKPVYPGSTLNAVSEIIGLKENSNKKTGIVYVRSRGFDDAGDAVLDYVRWVMVRKRDETAPAPGEEVPELQKSVEPARLGGSCPKINGPAYDNVLAGSSHRFGDYKVGEKIDHVDGVTVEYRSAPQASTTGCCTRSNVITDGSSASTSTPVSTAISSPPVSTATCRSSRSWPSTTRSDRSTTSPRSRRRSAPLRPRRCSTATPCRLRAGSICASYGRTST